MRAEYSTLCGRDHTSFRSFYYPVKVRSSKIETNRQSKFCFKLIFHFFLYFKSMIDGDLCEKFSNLDTTKQKSIAEQLDRTPNEVIFISN